MSTQRHTHLRVVLSLALNKNCGLQVVVPAGSEGALDEGAVFDSCLDLRQRKVFWKQHFAACNFILREKTKHLKQKEHDVPKIKK